MKVTIEIPDLVLQEQPVESSCCTQTCLAMAISPPMEEVVAQSGEGPMNYAALVRALEECNVFYNPFVFGTLIHQGWYFACVPSLNRIGGNHAILFRWTTMKGLFVIDAAPSEKYKADGSNLISWSELIAFIPGGKLPE